MTRNEPPQRRLGTVFLFLGLLLVGGFFVYAVFFVQDGRAAARRMNCAGKFSQLAVALYNYKETYGAFPPAYTVDAHGTPLHSWRVLILPFMEEHELYLALRLDEPWNSPHNRHFHDRIPSSLVCPDLPTGKSGMTTYLAVTGPDTAFVGSEVFVPDPEKYDPATIVLVAEARTPIPWMAPFDLSLEDLPKELRIHTVRGGPPNCHVVLASGYGDKINLDLAPEEIREKGRIREKP